MWWLPACRVAQMGNQSSSTSDFHPKPPVFPLPGDAALAGATRPGSCPLPAGIHHLYSVPVVLGEYLHLSPGAPQVLSPPNHSLKVF